VLLVENADCAIFRDELQVRTRQIPVDLSTSTHVMIRYVVVPVQAGDVVLAYGAVNVTNDVGRASPDHKRYAVGISTSLHRYNGTITPPEERALTWERLGVTGENVTPQGHHLTQNVLYPWVKVPEDWPAGHKAVIALMVDAHSTGWDDNYPEGGEHITVETHGCLIAWRYRQRDPQGGS
jgi:hypothetical protein